MFTRRSIRLLFPLLALGMTLLIAATAQAQDYRSPSGSSASATLRIDLGTTPRWSSISGTRVEEIAGGQRPAYDLFRYDGNYYAYHNDRWYMSRYDRGDFNMIDDRSVPGELSRVPRDHWRNYPQRWAQSYVDRPYQQPNRAPASLQVRFDTRPRWAAVHNTRVQEIRGRNRPDYDMFRYNGSYYAYSNNQWYMSRNGRGEFRAIDDRDVPSALARIPRDHWRNYPATWTDQQRRSR